MQSIVELNDQISFYLIVILVFISWMLSSIALQFSKNKLVYKYENHGFMSLSFKEQYFLHLLRRCYSSTSSNFDSGDNIIQPAKLYPSMDSFKKLILKENQNKSGIYWLTNLKTGDIYIGSSSNLFNRFRNYFNVSYLSRNNYIISRALIKYGYINFSLDILEYCDISILLEREQYYLDLLQPRYNILKLAGSSKGYSPSP